MPQICQDDLPFFYVSADFIAGDIISDEATCDEVICDEAICDEAILMKNHHVEFNILYCIAFSLIPSKEALTRSTA